MVSRTVAAERWRVAGHSVRGDAHLRDGLPNQDALETWSDDQLNMAIAAVADGHGGARHFRSGVGAKLAVAVTVRVLRELASALAAAEPAERSRLAAVEVPQRIVEDWVDAARAHLDAHPIGEDDWSALAQAEGEAAVAAVRAESLLAYGATLLAALVLPQAIALWQLGDGDVLAVGTDGRTTRPVPRDERLGGNVTTSICRPGAERDFCSIVLPARQQPALLLLSTDGYANSFRTDADFLKVGIDFAGLIGEHGLGPVRARLGEILSDASARGSGDDITLALLHREGARVAVPRAADAPAPSGKAADELLLVRQQIRQLRFAVAAMGCAVVLLAGWAWRDDLRRALVPNPAKPPAVAEPQIQDPGPSGPVARDQPAGPVVKEGPSHPTAASGSAESLAIEHARAKRGKLGIEVTAALSALPQAGCTARAAVWGKAEQELGVASAKIADTPLTLVVRYPPDDEASAKRMRQADATFTLRVDCGGQPVDTGRLPIQS
jgi:protein phosphatase 2C-like protein